MFNVRVADTLTNAKLRQVSRGRETFDLIPVSNLVIIHLKLAMSRCFARMSLCQAPYVLGDRAPFLG